MLYCKIFYNRFTNDSRDIQSIQENVLLKLIEKNKNTIYGKDYDFDKIKSINDYSRLVPIIEYKDILKYIDILKKGGNSVLTTDNVRRFVPTSGTSAATKFIPFNNSLQKDFSTALFTWLYDLYNNIPSIKKGRFFWVISPVVNYKNGNSKIPIEFAKDSSYFGKIGELFIEKIMAVPEFFSGIQDIDNYYYLLSWFLLKDDDLTLISLWNPSLLIIILEKILYYRNDLIEDIRNGTISLPNQSDRQILRKAEKYAKKNIQRANDLNRIITKDSELNRTNWESIWPKLKLISGWEDAWASGAFKEIQKFFPTVLFQGKGLLMTEGVVSIPLFDTQTNSSKTVLTSNIHFYEFIDIKTQKVFPAHQLKAGCEYEVIITTSGGLYRYKTFDIIRFEGYFKKHIHIKFIGKSNIVSDIRGEKLNVLHIDRILKQIINFPANGVCFLAPVIQNNDVFYLLFIENNIKTNIPNQQELVEKLDLLLQENFHYKNCRALKQLSKPEIFFMDKKAVQLYNKYTGTNKQISTIKNLSLITNPAISTLLLNQNQSK